MSSLSPDNKLWQYGGAYQRHDMSGVIGLPNDSTVQVCDWTLEMPEFMKKADTLFVDPPWTLGNARSFYTKAEIKAQPNDFEKFLGALFCRIDEIAPETLFLEMGKQFLCECLQIAKDRFRHVTFYNSTYFHKANNKCYVIHATNGKRRRYSLLEDQDEEDIIRWICENHPYQCIGDLCMGRGLVGKHAYLNGKRFVGTELNAKRLAVLVDFIASREHKCRTSSTV